MGPGDHITIYDITDDGIFTLIASLTESDEGPQSYSIPGSYWKKKIISCASNKMFVEFRSEDYVANQIIYGFSESMHYSPSPRKECKAGLDMTMKTIQSPSYPDSYDNNLDCKWLISVPRGSHITLKFLHFDVGFSNFNIWSIF